MLTGTEDDMLSCPTLEELWNLTTPGVGHASCSWRTTKADPFAMLVAQA
jgi:hypothetical protein